MREFTFDEIWPVMAPTLCRLHRVLFDATANANMMELGHPELARDGNMWSQHVRAYLIHALDVRIDEGEFALERGFNLSLTFQHELASLRVLKAPMGRLPQPGQGLGRRNWFNQDRGQFDLPLGLEEQKDPPEFAPHFIAKWSVNEDREPCELDLAYPKPTERQPYENKPQDWYWSVPVFDRTRPNYDAGPSLFEQDLHDVELKESDADSDEKRDTGTDSE